MRHQSVSHEVLLPECCEQTDNEICGEMNFSTTHLLSLVAAPTFAIMAFLTGIQDSGMQGMLCAATHGGSPLTGMVPMYLLMSAFHLAPWLRLITNWRRGACHLIGVR